MRKSLALMASLLLAVMVNMLAILPANAQSETRTSSGWLIPGQSIHIRKNPVIRVGLNANFPDGDLIADWDTDQPNEFRVCPEALVMALPSIKTTDTVSEFYRPMTNGDLPWKLEMKKGQTNPFLLPRRVPEDALSQQWEEFSFIGGVSTRGPQRRDLFLGDNEKSWWGRVVRGDINKFKVAGIQLWGSSRDFGTQIGIPIKVERLPEGLRFCKENKVAIAHWMKYESFSLPLSIATMPPAENNPPATTPPCHHDNPAPPMTVDPNIAILAAGIATNNRNINAVNSDLQSFKGQTTTVVNGAIVRIEDLEADLAALRAVPVPVPAITPPCAPTSVAIEVQVSGVCDSWYYQVSDNNGVKPQKGPYNIKVGTNMIHFDALSNEGSFQIRIFDCKSQQWGAWSRIGIAPAMGMQCYAFPGGVR